MDAAANIIDKTVRMGQHCSCALADAPPVSMQAKAGMGQVPVELSHPIHPATVHFPIAFMTAQFTLDALQHFTPGIFPQVSSAVAATSTGSIFSRLIPPASIVSPASMYLGGAGVAFSLISIATGLSELYGMVKGQTQEKGSLIKTIKDAYTAPESDVAATKLKTTLTHASLNDITGEPSHILNPAYLV